METPYRDEFIPVFFQRRPVTTLGQVKRLYITLCSEEFKDAETDTKGRLKRALHTKQLA